MCTYMCICVRCVYMCVHVGGCVHSCLFIKTVLFCFDKNLILLYKGKVVTADSLGQAVHPARCAPCNVAQ